MRKLALTILALTIGSCAPHWESLFDGESLAGWKVMNGGAKYEVADGEIHGIAADTVRNTFLVSERTFGDFILEYDFLTEGLNSGVQIRSHTDKARDITYGYQIEIDPSDRAWTGGIYEENGRGWLYRLYGKENLCTSDKWHHARVEAVGNSIRTWIDGIPCANLVDDRESEGFIALQVHAVSPSQLGKMIKWRNVRIMTEGVEDQMTPTSAPEQSTLLNCLTPLEEVEGWKLLFDGKSLKGWRSAHKDSLPEKGWVVRDGELIVEARNAETGAGGGGDIVTDSVFGDFILKVDYLLTPGANSGIKYFVDPLLGEGQGATIGCEFQVLDDNLHPDAKLGVDSNRTMASLYDLIPSAKGPWGTFQIAGWNTAMVKVLGKHVEHWLNGVKVLEYDRGSDMWNALVAYSKFHQWKGTFGNFTEGRILLQEHGDEVHFKNIKIKQL